MRKDQTKNNHAQVSAIAVILCLIGFAASSIFSSPAAAQVAALVNGEPVTAVDVTQRIKLLELMSHKKSSRPDALEELVNEKIKLQQAKRQNIEVPDSQIDRTLTGMAQRSNRKLPDFLESLSKAGADVPRFKTRLRAEIAWRQVLEQTSPGSFQVRDADLVAILTARGEQAQTKATQFSLQQIVLVVPRGAPEAVRAGRIKEAEALRSRFTNCEAGVPMAREIREVVIKDPVVRTSTDLGTQYRKLLDSTADGRMTPPEITTTGIEVVAVCSRREIIADISSRREFREELLTRRVSDFEKSYLDRLRKQSIIEYR
jgi:peptidyl-prolyl cis-trans isomerase SurA